MVRIILDLDGLSYSAYCLAALVASVITLVLTISWAAAIVLALFTILGVVNVILARLTQKPAQDALEAADERLGITTEIIDGIKATFGLS